MMTERVLGHELNYSSLLCPGVHPCRTPDISSLSNTGSLVGNNGRGSKRL